jgi:hypothetical protein
VISDGSIAGVVNVDGETYPFFILSVSSYSTTFAGMLSWEKTMPADLAGLFPAFAPISPAPASVATTTTAATTTAKTKTKKATTLVAAPPPPPVIPVSTAGFYDETVSNHDVRVYRDDAHRSVLLYGYWNQNTLIIARDPDSFSEIVQRLANSHSH